MPVDPSTLDSPTPTTLDGRRYPDHLRPYEEFDDKLLPLFADCRSHTFDDLSFRIDAPRVRAVLPRWIASATWRGLLERVPPTNGGPQHLQLTERGRSRL
jgi:hypothetical protein